MGIRSRKPDGKTRGKGGYWRYMPVPMGTRHKVTIAGPTVWVEVHRVDFSKPCRSALTRNALSCKWCGVCDTDWRGYTPVWDEDWTPRLVMLSALAVTVRDSMNHLDRAEVFRGPKKCDPVLIKPVLVTGIDIPSGLKRAEPADITECLLRTWGDGELAAWVRANPEPAEGGGEVAEPEIVDGLRVAGKGRGRGSRGASASAPAPLPVPDGPDVVDAAYERITSRIKGQLDKLKPSTNGKH